MNLKQRYRGSIYRRTLKLIISYSFLFCMLFYTNTYSKFATEQGVSPRAEVAKWEVEVTSDGNSNTTIELVPDGNSDKIHLGSTGHFDIVINPNDTEVSVNYIINFLNLPSGISVTSYEILEDANNTIYTIFDNCITDDINLNSNSEALSSLDTKTLRVYWTFDGIAIDVDSLTSGDKIYTIDVAVTTRQKLLEERKIKIKYVYAEDEVTFNGRSIIDSDIKLFSTTNKNRDFEVTANIDSFIIMGGQDSSYNTFLSCMKESGQPYEGLTLRYNCTTVNRPLSQFCFVRNVDADHRNNELFDENITISSMKLVRENNILYYDFNNTGSLTEDFDFTNVSAFDYPLTFGASLDSNMGYTRYTASKMSDLTVSLAYNSLEGSIILPSPTRTNYAFAGWYSDSTFTNKIGDGGASYNLSNNSTLYAKWVKNDFMEEYYNVDGTTFVGNGRFAIDTHLYPFTEENIHRNFEVIFDVVANESGEYSYLVQQLNRFQIQIRKSNGILFYRFSTNLDAMGECNPTYVDYNLSEVNRIRIVRINDVLYFSVNNYDLIAMGSNADSGGTNNFYSDLPLILGGNVESTYGSIDGTKSRETISNIQVRFLPNTASIEDYRRVRNELVEVYRHDGAITFNGSSDYIKPTDSQYYPNGLYLFNKYNYEKDFDVTFTITSVTSYRTNDTIFNTKRESSSTKYPGGVLKISGTNKITFDSRGGQAGKKANEYTVSLPVVVRIVRQNQKTYFYLDGVKKQTYDYTAFRAFHNIPLMFGCAVNEDDVSLRRWFYGTLSDIVVKVEP